MVKVCIWCQKEEGATDFNRVAHIFPQALGGKRACALVCDSCNTYFGSKQAGLPSVEIALKEPLNISRLYLLTQLNRHKPAPRFKSEYFDYDLKTHVIKPKPKYRVISGFQQTFTKQFKRGIYKIFLEERSESRDDAHDSRFDFIREYARYGIGDYPVYYCQTKAPAIFLSTEDLQNPVIRFTEHSDLVMQEYGFYSYYFITHMIAFPTIRTYELTLDNYARHLVQEENTAVSKMVPLRSITDLDFIFSYANP